MGETVLFMVTMLENGGLAVTSSTDLSAEDWEKIAGVMLHIAFKHGAKLTEVLNNEKIVPESGVVERVPEPMVIG